MVARTEVVDANSLGCLRKHNDESGSHMTRIWEGGDEDIMTWKCRIRKALMKAEGHGNIDEEVSSDTQFYY